MAHSTQFPPYRSHLLRMWVEPSPRCPPRWRFSLEDVATRQRCGFADLDALITHLLELMETPAAIELEGRSFPQSQELV